MKMKRIVIILLVLCFLPVTALSEDELSRSAISVDEKNILNTAVNGVFIMTHSVDRQSSFKTIIAKSLIDSAGVTKIGRFMVNNNTRDGFSVTLNSEKSGVLQPANTNDGEVAIPYSITLVKNGDIGEGIDYVSTFSSTALSQTVTVLAKAGDVASSVTAAEFSINININDDSNVMEMAGTYHDSIELVYTDH